MSFEVIEVLGLLNDTGNSAGSNTCQSITRVMISRGSRLEPDTHQAMLDFHKSQQDSNSINCTAVYDEEQVALPEAPKKKIFPWLGF